MTGLQISIIAMTILITVLVFLMVTAIMGKATEDSRTVSRRVERIRGKEKSVFEGFAEERKKRKNSIVESARSGRSLRKKKLMDVIFNELILADIMMKPEEFSVMWLVLVFGPSSLAALFIGNMLSSATLALAGAILPILFIKSKKKKRTKQFETQLGDALIIVCNCLRSGLTFQQAMETIGNEMAAPISVEFSRVVNEIKYGSTLEDALNNMVNRVKSADLMLAVSAINVQRQTGGNLSEILDTISKTIKERMRIKKTISALTAQGRISGLIIGSLPIALGGLLMVINPDYMMVFFTTTAGKIMLAVSAVMESIGFAFIRKVVTIEY